MSEKKKVMLKGHVDSYTDFSTFAESGYIYTHKNRNPNAWVTTTREELMESKYAKCCALAWMREGIKNAINDLIYETIRENYSLKELSKKASDLLKENLVGNIIEHISLEDLAREDNIIIDIKNSKYKKFKELPNSLKQKLIREKMKTTLLPYKQAREFILDKMRWCLWDDKGKRVL